MEAKRCELASLEEQVSERELELATVRAKLHHFESDCLREVADVCWDSSRFTVTSPKTKRYGKGTRVVPLFPELRRILDEAFAMADEGERWVVPMLAGKAKKTLGRTFKKIVCRAGVEVLPKPFQNLRSSRQTELEQDYPTYVVCEWLGNTSNIAHKHYLTVTEEHFQDAAENGGLAGDKRGMQPPVTPRTGSHKETLTPHEVRENATFSEVVDVLNSCVEIEDQLLLKKSLMLQQLLNGLTPQEATDLVMFLSLMK